MKTESEKALEEVKTRLHNIDDCPFAMFSLAFLDDLIEQVGRDVKKNG